MINRIRHNLFLSGQDEVQNLERLKVLGITAVLNVADNSLDPYYRATTVLMVKVGLEDNELNDPKAKDLAVAVLRYLLNAGYSVLVHCVAGASRSPYIVARYLAETEGRPVEEVLAELRTLRPEAFLKPALWRQDVKSEEVGIGQLPGK